MEGHFYFCTFIYLAIIAWSLIPTKTEHQKLADFLEFCLEERGVLGLEKGIQALIDDQETIDRDRKFSKKAFFFIKFKIQISLFKGRIDKKDCQKLMVMVREKQVKLGFLSLA
jgi:hypothetical protein